jgi:hypothetical protein
MTECIDVLLFAATELGDDVPKKYVLANVSSGRDDLFPQLRRLS